MAARKGTGFHSSSPPTVDLALDAIEATDLERRVVHLVCKVDSPRCALRVAARFWAARQESTQTEVRL